MFHQISHEEAEQLVQEGQLAIIDVRDRESFERGHLVGALNLSVQGMQSFAEETEKDQPVLVYCYHGISSQSVAQYLVDQGFETVYSLQGGFEVWKKSHPISGASS